MTRLFALCINSVTLVRQEAFVLSLCSICFVLMVVMTMQITCLAFPWFLCLQPLSQIMLCFGKTYTVTKATYNRVLGTNFAGRFSGRIARAILAQATLMAASPAFSKSGVTYEQAAQYAKAVLDLNGGISGIDPKGLEWYADPDMKNLSGGECPKEVLWRTEKSESRSLEEDNFPPSVDGKGRINPTQNFVDAFPMANGYPISNAKSGYNAQDPYAGRDPRLAKYVLYNGMTASSDKKVINTQADNKEPGNYDGLNRDMSKST